jgi:CRISPR-associated protein Csm3
MKLEKKIFITGHIKAETGLRIGGNKSSLEIGGVDINIIKSASGEPYVPGSSLKGKLRTLLGAKLYGKADVKEDENIIKKLFGDSGDKKSGQYTRLIVRDCPLDTDHFKKTFPDEQKRDFEFSEIKTENRIDRSSGKAEHPRQIERVPAGTRFRFSLLLDIYEGDDSNQLLQLLANGFEMLHYDYLGGHGSRGSGRVTITVDSISGKRISPDTGITDMHPVTDPIIGADHLAAFLHQTAVS